ncbi:MAG: outer membrane lipoprotein carrier protein LolA [Prolixibacteraceae bacterium]|nr:outer membrane lipoprotein carrier protein LolA [Prolixibacteraceae bacterium]
MTKFFLLMAFVFAAIATLAQQDQKAKEILDKVTQTTQAYKSIEATFSFEMENKTRNVKEINTGSIILKGNKYKVHLNELGVEVYSDGKNIWTYMAEANEVSISGFNNDDEDMMDPAKVFTIYQNGFDYKLVGEELQNGKSMYSIDLFPQDKNNNYSQIRVHIDKTKMLINSAIMKGKDGNTYTVKVDQFKTDKPYNDSFFVFDTSKHPNVEVIDMR